MSGQPKNVTQTNQTILSDEQKQLLNAGMGLTSQVTGNVPQLPSVPGFNAQETAGQQGILDKTASGGMVDQTTKSLAGAQDFLLNDAINPESNKALPGYIDAAIRPLSEQFTQSVIPGINHAATGTGAFGSFGNTKTAQNRMIAGNNYLHQVGDTSANILNNAYNSGLDAMTKGVAMAPQTQRAELFPETATAAVGDTVRGLQQQQSQQEFENEMFPFNLGMQLIGASAATPGGGSTGTVTGAQPGNPMMQLLGGALGTIAFL